MQRLALVISLAAAALVLPAPASAAPDAGRAGQCGIPTTTPVWIDFATEAMIDLWGQRGIVAGASTGEFPAKLRERGARTVYWDMNLNRRVGTPAAPADPDVIVERANRLFDFAAAQSACAKPLIALNELFGAHLPTPWSASNERYRQNVLVFLRTLSERGARPFLLISTTPYTGGEAAAWWQEASRYADLVPEVYFSARAIYKAGPVVGNRTMRRAFRRAIASLAAISIPSSKLGIVLGFQTAPGAGGREGLRPAQAWFETVKWQVLAARQVSQELRIGSVWSWGWAAYTARAVDPDKPAAACVYLWTRAPGLCDGPRAAGPGWNASRRDGQIVVPATLKCTFEGQGGISSGAVAALNRVTGDRDVALSILLARLVESEQAAVGRQKVLAAERAVVAARFGGSRSAYVAALRRAGATLSLARGALADELRRLRIEAGLRARRPSAAQVGKFYAAYPDLVARAVEAKPAPWWLGGKTTGLALEGLAPAQVFAVGSRPVRLRGIDGVYSLRALGEPQPLGTIPLAQARPAISSALAAFERRRAFEVWTVGRQEYSLRFAVCTRDELPTPGTIRISGFLPFLSLTGV